MSETIDHPVEQPAPPPPAPPPPAPPPTQDAPQPAYVTADALMPEVKPVTEAVPRRSLQGIESGLTIVHGLEVVPDSFAPATSSGEMIPHVRGPGQNPVDPVAAGIDLHNVPQPTDVEPAITPTGREASGREPATYVQHTAGAPLVKDSDVAPTSDPKG